MTILTFSILLFFIAIFAGIFGALAGLGGGAIIIPVLVLFFHIDIHYAMGAALISVIATSSGAAAAFLREGYTNLRIGMFLESGAMIGALIGAISVAYFSQSSVAIIFACILFISAYLTIRRQEKQTTATVSHPLANYLKLEGSHPTVYGKATYTVQRAPIALLIMVIAGFFSGLLGIGSGVLKVLAMDQAMNLPYKVSTTTSNFIIGITAAVSAGVYFAHGYIDPVVTFPVLIGAAVGSIIGAKLLPRIANKRLRMIFCVLICFLGVQMLYKAIIGHL